MTYGRPRYAAWYMGDPPRKLVTRFVRWFIAPSATVRYHALYHLNIASDRTRAAFLERVGQADGAVRMKVLVVLAHPVVESFAHAVHLRAVTGFERAGHEVRVLDLYRMGFDPVMSAEDREGYHTPELNETKVADHLDLLRWAEGLVFVYPTWWYSMPAMLKGWIDRVWVPHATFDLPKGLAPIRGRLHNIRLLGGLSTYGAPWW